MNDFLHRLRLKLAHMWRGDEAYFSLYTGLLTVTIGIIILVMLLWFAVGVAGHKALYNAGDSAAFAVGAPQSQN